MEHDDDRKLSELLKEWRVTGAPQSLDERVLRLRRPWWSFLFTGSIRVPVPVGLAVAGVLLVMAVALWKQRPEPASAASTVSLIEFRPVTDLNLRVIREHEAH
jgi:hypothetical protein